jgi:thymidylate synthase
MVTFKGENFADVYEQSLKYLHATGVVNNPRGTSTKEVLNVSLEITNPLSCLYKNPVRSSQFKYIAAEFLWYFSGRNDAEYITKYAKMWDSIKNADGTVNSAYGYLIFTERIPNSKINQYGWAIEALVMDPETRQSILHFNNASHQRPNNKDFVCTMYGIFHIRDNKLNFSIYMRSNDAVRGTPTDIAFFCTLQVQMWKHLKEFYPDLQLGSYTHVANSYHIYDTHYELVEKMLGQSFEPVSMPTLRSNLIHSNGTPTPELLAVMTEIAGPTDHELIFQEEDDILCWIYGKLQPKPVKNEQTDKV